MERNTFHYQFYEHGGTYDHVSTPWEQKHHGVIYLMEQQQNQIYLKEILNLTDLVSVFL